VADEKSARKPSAFTTDFQEERKRKRERKSTRRREEDEKDENSPSCYNAKVLSRELVKHIRRPATTGREEEGKRERERASYIE